MRAEQKGPVCDCPLSIIFIVIITMGDRLSLILLLFVNLHYEILSPSLIMKAVCPVFVVYGLGHIIYFHNLLCSHESQHVLLHGVSSLKSCSHCHLSFKEI